MVPPPLRRGELGLVDLLRALLMLPAVSHVLPEADEGAELGDGDVAAAVSIQRLPYRLDALVGQPILVRGRVRGEGSGSGSGSDSRSGSGSG